jgi:hypothetical protein
MVLICDARRGAGRRGWVAAVIGLVACPALCAAQGSAFGSYGPPYRVVAMPPSGPGSIGLVGDALPDGRLLVVTGLEVMRETAPGSGSFEVVGVLDSASMNGTTDPAFLRVSPDGQTIAIGGGSGRAVAVFASSLITSSGEPVPLTPAVARYYGVPHFDAAWADGSRLALTAGDYGSPARVTLLDVTSNPAAPINRTIVENIPGASGGIAFDAAGRLYTGNGYALPGATSTTGTIRAFDRSLTVDGATPADFETMGVLIGDVLSASALLFDREGNLIIGGGDFDAGDMGYLGVLSAAAIEAALSGAGAVDPTDPLHLLRLTPTSDPFAFYGSAYNPVTGELFARVTDFVTGANTWYGTIPGPAGAAAVIIGVGLAAARRRRGNG